MTTEEKLRTNIKYFAAQQKRRKTQFRAAKDAGQPHDVMNRLRLGIVYARKEIRHMLLAYALLQGRAYETLEQKKSERADRFFIAAEAELPQTPDELERIDGWLDGSFPRREAVAA